MVIPDPNDRIKLLEQKLDVITGEFNKVLADAERTIGLLTKGTAEALKALKRDVMHLEAGMENVFNRLDKLEGEEK